MSRHPPRLPLDPFFDLSLDPLWITTLGGHFRRVNAAFIAALGHPENDLLTRNMLDLIHPDDRPADAAALAAPTPPRDEAQRDEASRNQPPRDEDAAASASHLGLGEAFVQVFVNVGTREGVRAHDLQRLLAESGVAPSDVGGVRVRDRMSFVRVRRGAFDRAVAGLSGQVISGRTVVAELARGRV